MDSSKHHVSTEGCSSSESGWTIYIASPMTEDDYCSDDADEHDHDPVNKNGKEDYNNIEQDSDDSMASDASSGQQSHRDYGRIAANFKRGKGNNFNHCSSATKTNKKENKNDGNSNDKNRRLTANSKYSK